MPVYLTPTTWFSSNPVTQIWVISNITLKCKEELQLKLEGKEKRVRVLFGMISEKIENDPKKSFSRE